METRFLRASGGVSPTAHLNKNHMQFSPRKRRCFRYTGEIGAIGLVFSAQAEVFPYQDSLVLVFDGFLRASGGVSVAAARCTAKHWFSPRKRRCFSSHVLTPAALQVFSAQAEVFLCISPICINIHCFLRASGGVSRSRQNR